MNGFIKLERQIFDWEWYTEQDTSRMFIHLLLKANHKKARVNGKEIKRGQTMTSIQRLSDELSMSFFKVRKALANLSDTGEITIETTNKHSIVTINKYGDYQGFSNNTTNENQSNNNLNTTNNKDNNDIEDNINISQWQKNYLNNERLLSSVANENGLTPEFIKRNMISFVKTQKSIDDTIRSTREFNKHFLFYLRKIKSSIGRSYGSGAHNKRTF